MNKKHNVPDLDFNRRVGMFVRKHRISDGLSGCDLGKMIKISQQQVSRYERGCNSLSLYQLDQIIKSLNITWKDFVKEVIYFDQSDVVQQDDYYNIEY